MAATRGTFYRFSGTSSDSLSELTTGLVNYNISTPTASKTEFPNFAQVMMRAVMEHTRNINMVTTVVEPNTTTDSATNDGDEDNNDKTDSEAATRGNARKVVQNG